MVKVLKCVWGFGLLTAGFVGITAFFNWLLSEHRPLWTGVVMGLIFLPGIWLLEYADRRGWVKGFSWSRLELERRERELADARARILAEAKAKLRE